MSTILGIETSCDETGVAVVRDGHTILSNEVASQIARHAEFGGVVPEIASRAHTEIISQICGLALDHAGRPPIDAVAATVGPGLLGSLFVGVSFAKALALAYDVPFVPVHHLEGHLLSPFLAGKPAEFPFLALIVSGGHTSLIECRGLGDYHELGATRDDAVGESFDKVARLLELGYPGGPAIQRAAESGNPAAYDFPRGMAHGGSLEFSYSGLKTAVLYALQKEPDASVADIAASFQAAAVDVLIDKTQAALVQTGAPRLVVAGGVAANRLLRERLEAEISVPLHIPPFALCTDNAAMIACAGWYRYTAGHFGDLSTSPSPSLMLA